jgi:hypothetical protein
MPTARKKSIGKAASTRSAKKATPQHQPRRRKKNGLGVSRAVALRSSKRFGNPTERLQARLELEAKRNELTPLRADEKLFKLADAAALLGIRPWTLRNWALKDKCVYRRIADRMLMIPESEVERLRSHGN